MGSAITGQALKGIFTGIGQAKAMLDSEYIKPGTYWCRIDKNKVDMNRKRETFAATEMTVVHVIDGDGDKGHKIGNAITHIMMAKSDYFLGEIKGFLGNVFGLKPEEVDEDLAMTVYDTEQPLAGTVVEFVARNVVTRANTDFTRVSYKREVPTAELLEKLTPELRERFFPAGYLERRLAAEQTQQQGKAA